MRVVFIGTGEIGLPSLRALLDSSNCELVGVVTQPDKPVGRSQHLEAPIIKRNLDGKNIPVLQPKRIKDSEAVDQIRRLGPDVIVVMAYGQILPGALLQVPSLACINLHASLLPRWRGAAPIQAAIVAGDRKTGITVMYVDEGLDTGDILLQRSVDISPNETGASLHDRLGQLAPDALSEALRLLSSGKAPGLPQDNAAATIAPKLKREHGRIDWSEPADIIERKIRAYNPWPTAFTPVQVSRGEIRNLKIFSAIVVDHNAPPGEIIYADRRGLVIAAGKGALSLQEVQLEGKHRMPAAEFVRGHSGLAAPQVE